MKNQIIQAIQEAGDIIVRVPRDIFISNKRNMSPVTRADQASHDYLSKILPKIKNVPILSEEKYVAYNKRKLWQEYWLIDPLDGTKEFINGHKDFCINIALIKDNKPILGAIYAPMLNELYLAENNQGFEYYAPKLSLVVVSSDIIVAVSRYHNSEKTKNFMDINNLHSTYIIGSALKFGRMALGQIDLYPRFDGSKEWDTGAGQVILKEANCQIIDLITSSEPSYNKTYLENNYFIASNRRININKFNYSRLI